MIIELDFKDLRNLASNSEVVKSDITIKVNRPVRPMLNTIDALSKGDEYVVFSLDSTDWRSSDFRWVADPRGV